MAHTMAQMTCGLLSRVERLLRRGRLRLTHRGQRAQTDRPNDAGEWARLYAAEIEPVRQLTSPLAKVLADLTAPGEVLLETGCGAAALSAELATAGRIIELADFSHEILDRARRLFAASGLPEAKTTWCDLTQPLPWTDRSVDVVWSSGVLEHWTDAELIPIVREQARVSRRLVISLVPYAGCLSYRWGKAVAENAGVWPYGRELPRESLRDVFAAAGLGQVQERTVWSEAGINFLDFVDIEIRQAMEPWFRGLPETDPLRRSQGYLLLTTGEVQLP